LLLFAVKLFCGDRIGWAWYGAVAVLSLLLAPDKEAAAVFVALGYYPIVQSKLEKMPLQWLWKGLLFNLTSAFLYAVLMYVFGMEQLIAEFQELGVIGLIITLILGNVCFFLLDRVLHMLRLRSYRKWK